MKQNSILILLLLITFNNVKPQNAVFPDSEIFATGVYYYPEHWPQEQWERDLKNIADMGFEFTHFCEFAWAFMEPEEGKYTFEWLDKAVELAAKYGLKVIMCTPTPTPPAWLTHKHPEVMIKNPSGVSAVHGTRQQASWSSEIYRDYVGKITHQLGKRYGKDNRVIGWQLDNEPSHYGWTEDYNEAAHARFQQWLKAKYINIETLNKEWGAAFWSQVYNNFEQVAIPNETRSPIDFINPHAVIDWKRFNADEAADFLRFQTNILREYTTDQWITTNYMAGYMAVDPWRSEYLDYISWTAYPVSGYGNGIGSEGFRRGTPFPVGFASDRFRPYSKGKTGVMEIQISQVSWGNYNPRLYPGMRKVFLYHTLAGGNSFACFYRYRQPTFGFEQDILGIVGTDGVTLTDGGEEIVEFMKEIRDLRGQLKNLNPEMPSDYRARRTAILWSNDQFWSTTHRRQTDQWDFMSIIQGYYNILKSMGCMVDFISEDDDFSQYAALIAPAYELADEGLVEKWKAYAEQGGQLILTARTATKTKTGHYPEAKRAEIIAGLIGAQVDFFDNMPPSQTGTVLFNNQPYQWNTWAEGLTVNSAKPIVTFNDQFYKGQTAVTRKEYGKGSVTFIGVVTNDYQLERDVVRDVFTQASIPLENYPEGVIIDWHNGLWIGVNYSDKTYIINKDTENFLIGGNELNPAGVAVWKE
ncbi:MAG: beta-galactosidase [Bacteroidales bacterium]